MAKLYQLKSLAFACVLLFLDCNASYSQTSVCDTIYGMVDQMPTYKKHHEDLSKDFYRLQLIKDCKPDELQQVIWVIDKKGNISNVEVVGPLKEICKNYVIEHATALTEWKPGMHNGKPVCVKVVLAMHIRPTK